MKRILFANIGWMAHYRGNTATDRILDGGSWNPEDKHEVFNFQNEKGKYYGYVETGEMDLSRIDNDYDGKGYIDNVLVIWTARNKKIGRCIVGWYKNATVYANYCESGLASRNEYGYNIVANAKDCVLLPPDKRTMTIPTGKGFFGRYLTWFADGLTCETKSDYNKVQKFRNEVVEYVQKIEKETNKKKGIRHADYEARTKVEKAAVDYVISHYRRLGYKIKDVQKDNTGWDLEASMKNLTLKIEVKGLADSVINVLLSDNEYKKMNDKNNREEYRLCVVTKAIKNPELTTFLHYGKEWAAEDDPSIVLEFKSRTIEAAIRK